MNLGPAEIGLIILAILLLFGYKKLPDASRSLGRSLRIFKGEMKGLKDDDLRGDNASTVSSTGGRFAPPSLAAESGEADAHLLEVRAVELGAGADQAHGHGGV
jgi:sec-independent protein translocase protein TatA